MSKRKLCLDEKRSEIFGVCAGLSKHFKLNLDLIRFAFLYLFIFGNGMTNGFYIYWILFVIMWWNTKESR